MQTDVLFHVYKENVFYFTYDYHNIKCIYVDFIYNKIIGFSFMLYFFLYCLRIKDGTDGVDFHTFHTPCYMFSKSSTFIRDQDTFSSKLS